MGCHFPYGITYLFEKIAGFARKICFASGCLFHTEIQAWCSSVAPRVLVHFPHFEHTISVHLAWVPYVKPWFSLSHYNPHTHINGTFSKAAIALSVAPRCTTGAPTGCAPWGRSFGAPLGGAHSFGQPFWVSPTEPTPGCAFGRMVLYAKTIVPA